MRLTAANDKIRSENVTASEVGALLGEHPYMTPEKIYDRLTGATSPEPPNEFMDTDSHMEAAILRLAEKRLGIRARQNSRTYVHPKVRLCATPDALVLTATDDRYERTFVVEAVPGLVEVKLSGRQDLWRSVPEHVEWQVRAQMACTGRRTAAIAVLVGAGLRTFILEHDPWQEERLLTAVDDFWTQHIVPGVRPEPTTDEIEVHFR